MKYALQVTLQENKAVDDTDLNIRLRISVNLQFISMLNLSTQLYLHTSAYFHSSIDSKLNGLVHTQQTVACRSYFGYKQNLSISAP